MGRLFAYKWYLPSKIFANLWWAYINISRGIRNLITWFSVIFWLDWIDWSYLCELMEKQLRIMADRYKKYGSLTNKDKTVRETLICANLLKRLINDDYLMKCREGNKGDYDKADRMQEYDKELLFKIMSKHLFTWWD
jgi:hypothetical protein